MTTVWVKLYRGKDDEEPSKFKINNFDGVDVDDLKKKIKEEEQLDFPASRLTVNPQQADDDESLPWNKGVEKIDPGDEPSTRTRSREPLIVLAPKSGKLVNGDSGTYTLGPAIAQ